VFLYFISRIEVVRSLNLNLDQKDLNLYKEFNVYPVLPNPSNLTRVKG
jgi:hypothetical protein